MLANKEETDTLEEDIGNQANVEDGNQKEEEQNSELGKVEESELKGPDASEAPTETSPDIKETQSQNKEAIDVDISPVQNEHHPETTEIKQEKVTDDSDEMPNATMASELEAPVHLTTESEPNEESFPEVEWKMVGSDKIPIAAVASDFESSAQEIFDTDIPPTPDLSMYAVGRTTVYSELVKKLKALLTGNKPQETLSSLYSVEKSNKPNSEENMISVSSDVFHGDFRRSSVETISQLRGVNLAKKVHQKSLTNHKSFVGKIVPTLRPPFAVLSMVVICSIALAFLSRTVQRARYMLLESPKVSRHSGIIGDDEIDTHMSAPEDMEMLLGSQEAGNYGTLFLL